MAELMYDEFKIICKRELNNDDINSFTKLYLPLIGIDSYALYFCLASLDDNKAYNYKMLIDMLNLKGLNSINKASYKLEAVGLLRVYKNKDNNYLYDIIRPLEMDAFLKDEAMCAVLAGAIGLSEVENLKEKYLKNILYKKSSYKELTKKFEDVFDISTSNDVTFAYSLFAKQMDEIEKIKIENKEFNYVLFKMLFDDEYLNDAALENNDFKANILRLSFVYKLDEEQMKDVVINALSIDKDLNYATLAKFAKIAYKNKNNSDTPYLVTKEYDDYLNSIKDDRIASICNRVEAMSPSEVLEEYNNGYKASSAEISMFDKLSKETGTPISVINIMIMNSIDTKNGEIPGYAYFEKIASTWKRAKIKNSYDAMKYIINKHEERENKQANPRNKRVVKEPEWYKKYKEELDKDLKVEENKEALQDDGVDAAALVKELFGEDNGK